MDYLNRFTSTLDRKLEPPVKAHLKKVYGTLSMAVLSATLGSYAHLYTNLGFIIGNFFNLLITIGFTLALYMTPDNGKNQNQRLTYLMGLSFFSGLSLGPLIEATLFVNSSILPTALVATAFIFGCFTMSAIFANRRDHLYLGALLSSGLSLLFYMALLNIFLGSYLVFKAYVYISFAMMCAFIIYDTSKIIEMRLHGDSDFIGHAGLLFVDLVQVFRHLLVILTDKERSNNKRNKRN